MKILSIEAYKGVADAFKLNYTPVSEVMWTKMVGGFYPFHDKLSCQLEEEVGSTEE